MLAVSAETISRVGAPILRVTNVSKTFGGVVRALDKVSISVGRNEILGVVGENGAGKTTLMKVMVGVHEPDEGALEYRGQEVPFPSSPKQAAQRGISIVYQEKGVVPSLRVYQFLLLGHEHKYGGATGLRLSRMKRDAESLLREFQLACGPDDFMYSLPLSVQKMVEIARAILTVRLEQGSKDGDSVIILDEPTAPLTIEERQGLLEDVSKLKTNTSFVFVTHIMQEVMEFMDRVVVLRDGNVAGEYDMSTDGVTEETLTRVIVGKEVVEHRTTARETQSRAEEEGVVLGMEGLAKHGAYYDVSLELHRGECLGIQGPAGSGKSEVIRTIGGLLRYDDGILRLKGRTLRAREPAHSRLARGIGYFSGKTENELFHDWPITKNVSLLNMRTVVGGVLRLIRFAAERAMAMRIMEKLRIRAAGLEAAIATLSGGSKQKVTVGKWFERSPEILLIEDPTIGIDVGSREDIYETMIEMKSRGISMILVSDDPKEYATLCDRIVAIRQGRVERILSNTEFRDYMEM